MLQGIFCKKCNKYTKCNKYKSGTSRSVLKIKNLCEITVFHELKGKLVNLSEVNCYVYAYIVS